MLENKKTSNDKRFDSYLNKIIIFTSKKYFKEQMKIANNEKIIVDDEDYASFLQNFLMVNCAFSTVDDFEDNTELNNALQSLSAIKQSVIFLLFKEELNQDEAAKILEICSKSVSRIKLRAIEKLRKYLKGDCKNGK